MMIFHKHQIEQRELIFTVVQFQILSYLGSTFNEINLDGGTIGEIIFNSDSQATDVVNVTP